MNTELKFPLPVEGDCAPYFFRYIVQVPHTDIEAFLEEQRTAFGSFIEGLTPKQLQHRYAPGKWSLAEMIGHVFDTERVFAYRMLCVSRGDKQNLPGFEQDDYVKDSKAEDVSANELKAEWDAIRSSTIFLCRHMTAEMAARIGLANDVPVRAYAYPYMMAGHVIHHLQIGRERYLTSA